jgi:hypothetical protein
MIRAVAIALIVLVHATANADRISCVLDRCVPIHASFDIAEMAVRDCDSSCPPLGENEYLVNASDWVNRGDMWIAAPTNAEQKGSGAWLLQAYGSIEQVSEGLKLHKAAGAVGKMLRRWKGAKDGSPAHAMHLIQYPHPEHGPGCDPTPPPTPPPPPPPAQCHPTICAGDSNQYPVMKGERC